MAPKTPPKTLQNRWKIKEDRKSQYAIVLDETIIPQSLEKALQEAHEAPRERLRAVGELQQVPQMGSPGPKSLPRGTPNGSGTGLRASFSAMRSSLRIGVLNVWTKNVPLLVKLMFRTPVRCTALNYFFGVGGSGRRPLEF